MLIFVFGFDQSLSCPLPKSCVVFNKDQKVVTKTSPNQIRPQKPKPLLSQSIVKPKSEENEDEFFSECKWLRPRSKDNEDELF